MGPAAGLGGPPLARSAVAVQAAVLALVRSAGQNVLNVLYYQVDGHCREQEQVRHNPPREAAESSWKNQQRFYAY